MKSYRIDEKFSSKQIKGINMAVKALSADYDFITGWELGEMANEYASVIYIDLIVDLDKVNEFYLDNGTLTSKTQIRKYWLDVWKEDDNYSTFFLLSFSDSKDNRTDETKQLKAELDEYYKQIPEIFATNYVFENDDLDIKREYRCELNINSFMNKPRGNVYFSKV